MCPSDYRLRNRVTMAGWISSKLKVAETFLQQIDQQAAESLGKDDKRQSDELNLDSPRKTGETLPLKDQLKKKRVTETHLKNGSSGNNRDRKKEIAPVVGKLKSPVNPNSDITDGDWTELLSAPSSPKSPPGPSRSNAVPGITGLRKDIRKQGLNLKGQNGGSKASSRSDIVLERRSNAKSIDGRKNEKRDLEFTALKQRVSDATSESDCSGRHSSGRELRGNNNVSLSRNAEAVDGKSSIATSPVETSVDGSPKSIDKDTSPKVDRISDANVRKKDDDDAVKEINVPVLNSDSLKKGSFTSSSINNGESDSETDSTSTSGSESEGEREERKRRSAQILAEKTAAKARKVIEERENMVARLEGEKQSLEKILEERAKQQVQEASELQKTMTETMDAADVEKQKHNNTRMEALARVAKLETTNADLARSVAAAQWNLEVEVNRLAELRQQIEVKESKHEELRRKISTTHSRGNHIVASKGAEFEQEILEAEYSFLIEKIGHLHEKARTLESDIQITQNEMENPTEVEVELKRRLHQLTDHLIQKQAQVEALSSEKATLLFRIETVSSFLDGSKAMLNDEESGIWELSNSKLKPLLANKIHSGRQHFGSLVQQLDSIFCAGYAFLRRNSTARIWSIVYVACLHLWVMYIMFSRSSVSVDVSSGAVFSLENINKTGGM
ncbi:golgin candidate 2 [Impatiens glandulifera]|uniref:golgin candidate 2 n=1 Tax=Impatiens glandulifera TaxID=253017 RepID=UPI001FB13C22|nr:golgin candidate 2 [Impatiens glandulifera]